MRLLEGLRKALLTIGLALAIALVPSPSVHAAASFDDIAIELMCQCGCRLTVPACNMPECSVQKKMSEQIKFLIDKGQSKDEIIKSFVDNYGEEVLAAPTKKGFNLTAWLMPFAAIAAGIGFVYMVVDQWVLRRGRSSDDEEDAGEDEIAPAELPEYEKRLKEELEEYEGGA